MRRPDLTTALVTLITAALFVLLTFLMWMWHPLEHGR